MFSKRNLILILIIAAFIAYFPSFRNPFIWDDEQFITSNAYIQNFDVAKIFTTSTTSGAGVKSNYYRPLTSLSFALDTKIWGSPSGGATFGFHLTNTILHMASGIFLFLLLTELGFPQILAFLVSLIFLVHPIQTEAVVYINSRGDSLYTFFLFFSLFIFTKALRKKNRKAILLRMLSIVLFFASVLAKEIALAGIPLYLAILVLDSFQKKFPLKHFFKRYAHEIGTVIFMVLGVGLYIGLRLTIFNFANTLNFYNGQNEYTQNLLIRLFTFCKVFFIYMQLLFFPYQLHMERTVNLVKSVLSPFVWGTIALLAGGVFLCIFEIFKKKSAYILFSFSLFISFLVPVSGIVPINGILYEHWLYVPMVGFFLLLFSFLWIVIPKNFLFKFRHLLIPFILLVSVLYISLTIHQDLLWSNPITFYTYTLQFADTVRLHNNLGIEYANVGRIDDAIVQYKRALQDSSRFPEIYNNLGNAYVAKKDYTKAEENFNKAIDTGPNFITPYLNLANLYLKEKRNFDAFALMASVSEREPFTSNISFILMYGRIFRIIGNQKSAQIEFDKAEQLSHNDPQVLQVITQLQQSTQ